MKYNFKRSMKNLFLSINILTIITSIIMLIQFMTNSIQLDKYINEGIGRILILIISNQLYCWLED